MTTSILITVIAGGLGLAFGSVGIVLAVLLLWQGRRIGDASILRQDLDTVRTQVRNLDEIFESYRTRAAQRVSTDVQRSKREAAATSEAAAPTPILSRDDIVKRFNESRSATGSG